MGGPLSFGDALSWLDGHLNSERNSHMEFPPPSLVKMVDALAAIGDPHKSYPVVHVTGTNGKGSTSRMITALFMAHGLQVGTYLSPHLHSVNERIQVDLEPISDRDLADELSTLKMLEVHSGKILSWFEIVTAAAFSHFDTVGLDVAVVEVGMGGIWDATNVVDGEVAVVTNVSLDHVEVLGPELTDIAKEKAGIIKPSSRVVLGVDSDLLLQVFLERPNDGTVILGRDLLVRSNTQAIGGRVLSIKTKRATYTDVFLPLFGPHQGENAAIAISAVEEFFDRSLDLDVVRAAFERVSSPGRMEVVSRSPLVILDAAHNPAGMLSAKVTMLTDFSAVTRWHLVVSMLKGRDPRAMFFALKDAKVATLSIAEARSARAMSLAEMGGGAREAGFSFDEFETVAAAISSAVERCKDGEAVLVCGSIYTVAEAREGFIRR